MEEEKGRGRGGGDWREEIEEVEKTGYERSNTTSETN